MTPDLQLPDDVETLKAMVPSMAEKAARTDALESEVADLKARNADADCVSAWNIGSDAILVVRCLSGANDAGLRSSIFPRPYIQGFTSLSLVICPSVCPFDQGELIAALTAAQSLATPLAKAATKLDRA
jgi:hypothetical protein